VAGDNKTDTVVAKKSGNETVYELVTSGSVDIEFTFDALTKKKEDLVEILGKEYVGLGVITNKAFTLVAKPGSI
jgi:hypothetical protein